MREVVDHMEIRTESLGGDELEPDRIGQTRDALAPHQGDAAGQQQGRHEQLEGAVNRAEAMLAEAEHRAKAFEEKIQIATVKGIDARNRIRAEATKEMNARIEQERSKLGTRVEGALRELQVARREALADAHVEATRLAELAAQKLLGRRF